MALADILKRIDRDAELEMADIIAAAEADAERARATATSRAAAQRAAAVEHARQQAEEDARTRVAAARLRGRDRVLAEKRVLIDRALARAIERIDALDDAGYASLMAREIARVARGGEVVRPGSADAERLTAALPAALAAAGCDATVGSPTGDLERGALLEGSRMRVEVSARSMVESDRAALEALVAGTLFGGDE